MMATEQPNMWVFKSVADADRSYISIEGYDDDVTSRYEYDSNVANHKRVSKGDVAVLVNKEHILGFAKIADITTGKATKTIRKCPTCGATNFEPRKNKKPLYRCNKGHEFNEDEMVTTTTDVITYKSSYKDSFLPPTKKLDISELRPYYASGYNQNMSIQSLSPDFFKEYFKEVPKQLEEGKQVLLSIDAEDDDLQSTSSYTPNSDDEREKINRQIKARRGQRRFRNRLRKRYGNICMVTGCEILDIIEAAHINPYRGEKDNDVANGLLLRSDIHTLFDLNLLGIHPETLKVHVHTSARVNGYEQYHEATMKGCENNVPSKEALAIRWKSFDYTT
jgi:putative restriction endonuclease